jgi:hypothetical protein
MASCHAAAISAVRYQGLDILGFNGRLLYGFCSLKYGRIPGCEAAGRKINNLASWAGLRRGSGSVPGAQWLVPASRGKLTALSGLAAAKTLPLAKRTSSGLMLSWDAAIRASLSRIRTSTNRRSRAASTSAPGWRRPRRRRPYDVRRLRRLSEGALFDARAQRGAVAGGEQAPGFLLLVVVEQCRLSTLSNHSSTFRRRQGGYAYALLWRRAAHPMSCHFPARWSRSPTSREWGSGDVNDASCLRCAWSDRPFALRV